MKCHPLIINDDNGMIKLSGLRHFSSRFKMNHDLMDIKTFVFLDIETTGLPKLENNKTKITELCMVAVEASHIRLGVFPRVQNKLNFSFNPWKLISSESEKLTGLSNYDLEHQSKFSSDTVNTINGFLNHNQKPFCFVAHNGDKFDYPILCREIENTNNSLIDDIVCIDSLQTFKQLYYKDIHTTCIGERSASHSDCLSLPVECEGTISGKVLEIKKLNETTPKKQLIEYFPSIPDPAKKPKLVSSMGQFHSDVSFKLTDIYTRLTKRSPVLQHQAEADVMMLIMCAATLGDRFVDWANTNAKKFCDIPAMVPGKKIGT